MRGFLNRMRLTRLFFRLVKDPNNTELIFKAVEIVTHDRDQTVVLLMEERLLKNETFKKMYEARQVPIAPKMDYLARLPVQSFGHAVYKHMSKNELAFNLFPNIKINRPIDYLTSRIYQEHDLWHVLLGYDTSIEDELALQAFGVAQYQSPISVMIITGGLLHLFRKNPMDVISAFKKIIEGYFIGRNAKFLLDIKLHDYFEKPLHEVRALCHIS